MLDTNILVDFVLVYLKNEKKERIPPGLIRSNRLLEFYESGNFFNFMSSWNKFELRDVIMQLKLQQKWVLSGYSVREFGDAKKEIILTTKEQDLVNQIVFDIWKFSQRKTVSLVSDDRIQIEKLNKSGFSFMDILLIQQAEKLNCDYFVTKDTGILNKKNVLSAEFKVKILSLNEFIDKLR